MYCNMRENPLILPDVCESLYVKQNSMRNGKEISIMSVNAVNGAEKFGFIHIQIVIEPILNIRR